MNRFASGFWFFLSFLLVVPLARAASDNGIYFAKYVELVDGSRQLLAKGKTAGRLDAVSGGFQETVSPRYIIEHQPFGGDLIVVLTAKSMTEIDKLLALRKVEPSRDSEEPIRATDEVKTIISNGAAANRIDLVFMGDGYTVSEKSKFFSDATHLADQMFKGATFQSYLPLFNVHAVFRASAESGIGKNNVPKNTAYGLYREGETLRAILPTNTGAAMSSCRKAPGCDYPIIIANDPYYGGLGGGSRHYH